jgi:hypothetical protein
MIDKTAEIRKLLAQGKTTRKIARMLRVSLRDIHRVRQQEGIDIGALEREKELREKDIGVLENRITQMRQELAQLEKQNSTLLRQKNELEAEIERKKTEVINVKQPVAVEHIYFPSNYMEVIKYLKTLSTDQLQYISQVIVSIANDRLIGALRDQKTRIDQQTRDTLKRSFGNF